MHTRELMDNHSRVNYAPRSRPRVWHLRDAATSGDRSARKLCLIVAAVGASLMLPPNPLWAASPASNGNSHLEGAAQPVPSASELGLEFVNNSSSSIIVERNGKRYLVDLASHTVRDAG